MSAKSSLGCRACGHSELRQVLDLGLQPLANNLLRPTDLKTQEPRFPLVLYVCPSCWLIQIGELVPPVELFSEYLYFSSFSDAMLRHAATAATRYRNEFDLNASSFAVEIASNDGYLLKNFVTAGVPCLGIEPAQNIAQVARDAGVPTETAFFGRDFALQLAARKGQADLILGNNVFAHAPDIQDFIQGLKALLNPKGRVILEFPYAVAFLEHREFDTIYHEHVFYFSLLTLIPLFARFGLQVDHVEALPIHGGSLRLFASHQGACAVRDSVDTFLEHELKSGLNTMSPYSLFASEVTRLGNELRTLLTDLKRSGKTIAAYGASAKGSTLLNHFGIGSELLDFVVDRSTHKQGRLTPGTHLPILAPSALLERKPDYTLLLTWNFAEEILTQQTTYRERGGKFILPIPDVKVV